MRSLARAVFVTGLLTFVLSACGMVDDENVDSSNYPKTQEDRRKERLGKLTGENGLTLGGSDDTEETGNNPLGVNSFLWRATLDTLAFMPLASADPFGGVVLTDWYEDPKAVGERFKVNALILDRQLRADSIKVSVFKQKKGANGQWADEAVDIGISRKLEDAVLTRARELRVAQLGY